MTTSTAAQGFAQAIQEAWTLLDCFDRLSLQPDPVGSEAVKRAGLLMALTAWQNYVEDRLREAVNARWTGAADEGLGRFAQNGFEEEIRQLREPGAEETLRLFRDHARQDLRPHWRLDGTDAHTAASKLDGYLRLRRQLLRRALVGSSGPAPLQAVAREELLDALHVLQALVEATERALSQT